MKKRITRIALKTAMPKAIGVLNPPKSCIPAQMVRTVSTIKALKVVR